MRRCAYLALLLFISFVPAIQAADLREGKIVKEVWEAGTIDGVQVGYIHGLYREIRAGDRTIIEASTELELNLIRFGQPVKLWFAMANHESAQGQLFAFAIRQTLSKDQEIVRKAKVDGKELILSTQFPGKTAVEKRMAHEADALALYGEEQLFADRELKPGTKFDYRRFDPAYDVFLAVHVEIKVFEETPLLKGEKRKLLRVEKRLDKIQGIELPGETLWIDKDGEIHKRQLELPGLGDFVAYRTTKEQAMAVDGKAVDIGLSQLIKLNQGIAKHQEAKEITFRVRLKGVEDSAVVFPADVRQEIRNPKNGQFELVVRRSVPPEPTGKPALERPAEYLRTNHFLTSDNEQVKAHAKKAVGDEKDAWKKALLIESWVKKNIANKNFTEAFATADEVARTLEGDCTEHAVLAAAMCRSVGVPSRTAIGLVYSPADRAMAFHMWFEVWIEGHWHPLDATQGLGGITATHIKICDAHWNDTQSFMPLLPVLRVLGKVKMEVVQ